MGQASFAGSLKKESLSYARPLFRHHEQMSSSQSLRSAFSSPGGTAPNGFSDAAADARAAAHARAEAAWTVVPASAPALLAAHDGASASSAPSGARGNPVAGSHNPPFFKLAIRSKSSVVKVAAFFTNRCFLRRSLRDSARALASALCALFMSRLASAMRSSKSILTERRRLRTPVDPLVVVVLALVAASVLVADEGTFAGTAPEVTVAPAALSTIAR